MQSENSLLDGLLGFTQCGHEEESFVSKLVTYDSNLYISVMLSLGIIQSKKSINFSITPYGKESFKLMSPSMDYPFYSDYTECLSKIKSDLSQIDKYLDLQRHFFPILKAHQGKEKFENIKTKIDYLEKFKAYAFLDWLKVYDSYQMAKQLLITPSEHNKIRKKLSILCSRYPDFESLCIYLYRSEGSFDKSRGMGLVKCGIVAFFAMIGNSSTLMILQEFNIDFFRQSKNNPSGRPPLLFLLVQMDMIHIAKNYIHLKGIDFNITDHIGNTILHVLARRYYSMLWDTSIKNKEVKLKEIESLMIEILKMPAIQINQFNHNGETAFLEAVGASRLVKIFLKFGADIFAKKEAESKSAFYMAIIRSVTINDVTSLQAMYEQHAEEMIEYCKNKHTDNSDSYSKALALFNEWGSPKKNEDYKYPVLIAPKIFVSKTSKEILTEKFQAIFLGTGILFQIAEENHHVVILFQSNRSVAERWCKCIKDIFKKYKVNNLAVQLIDKSQVKLSGPMSSLLDVFDKKPLVKEVVDNIYWKEIVSLLFFYVVSENQMTAVTNSFEFQVPSSKKITVKPKKEKSKEVSLDFLLEIMHKNEHLMNYFSIHARNEQGKKIIAVTPILKNKLTVDAAQTICDSLMLACYGSIEKKIESNYQEKIETKNALLEKPIELTEEGKDSWKEGLSTALCGVIKSDEVIWKDDESHFVLKLPHTVTIAHAGHGQTKMIDREFIEKQMISRLEKQLQSNAHIDVSVKTNHIKIMVHPKQNLLLKHLMKKIREAVQDELFGIDEQSNQQKDNEAIIQQIEPIEKMETILVKDAEKHAEKSKDDTKLKSMLIRITDKDNLFSKTNAKGFLKFDRALQGNRWKYHYSEIENSSISTQEFPIALNAYFKALRDVCNAYYKEAVTIYHYETKSVIIFHAASFEKMTLEEQSTLKQAFQNKLQSQAVTISSLQTETKIVSLNKEKITTESEDFVSVFLNLLMIQNLDFHFDLIQRIEKINNEDISQLCWAAYLFQVERMFLILSHIKAFERSKDFYDVRTILRHAFDELEATSFYAEFQPILKKLAEIFIHNSNYKSNPFSVHVAGRNIRIDKQAVDELFEMIGCWKQSFESRIKAHELGSKNKDQKKNNNAIEVYRANIAEFQQAVLQFDDIKTSAILFCYCLIAEASPLRSAFLSEVYTTIGHAEIDTDAKTLLHQFKQNQSFYLREDRPMSIL